MSLIKDESLNWKEVYVNAEISEEVKSLIDNLPSEQKEVVFLRYYKKLPFNEICLVQGVSINTSLGRMRYALINLRRLIKEQNLDLDGYLEPG